MPRTRIFWVVFLLAATPYSEMLNWGVTPALSYKPVEAAGRQNQVQAAVRHNHRLLVSRQVSDTDSD